MNCSSIIEDDIVNCLDGFCISIWFNGCDIRCKNCHNSKIWDAVNIIPNEEVVSIVSNYIEKAKKRGIEKQLSILGGEPLTKENRNDCYEIMRAIKYKYPDIKINFWSGRTLEEIEELKNQNTHIRYIINNSDILVLGPYIDELKCQLPLRGSKNQILIEKGQIIEKRYPYP